MAAVAGPGQSGGAMARVHRRSPWPHAGRGSGKKEGKKRVAASNRISQELRGPKGGDLPDLDVEALSRQGGGGGGGAEEGEEDGSRGEEKQ
jgi:hypothetical protein